MGYVYCRFKFSIYWLRFIKHLYISCITKLRSAVSYTHSGITGTGAAPRSNERHIRCQDTGGSISSLQHPLPFASKREPPFIHSPGPRNRNRLSALWYAERHFAFLSLFFLSTQQSAVRAACIQLQRQHVPVFPIQQRVSKCNP